MATELLEELYELSDKLEVHQVKDGRSEINRIHSSFLLRKRDLVTFMKFCYKFNLIDNVDNQITHDFILLLFGQENSHLNHLHYQRLALLLSLLIPPGEVNDLLIKEKLEKILKSENFHFDESFLKHHPSLRKQAMAYFGVNDSIQVKEKAKILLTNLIISEISSTSVQIDI